MKVKILFVLFCILPMTANAAIPYRVQQDGELVNIDGLDSQAFAREYRFYIGGAYDFDIWQNAEDNNVVFTGKTSSSFEGVAGIRLYDTFRLEANYIRQNIKWDIASMTNDMAMVNAIFDARIDNIYRLFKKQRLVPYVGFGAGVSWNSADDISFETKITPALSALAGISVELGNRLAIDFGYRYMYIFSPKFNNGANIAPVAHQLRAGARFNF